MFYFMLQAPPMYVAQENFLKPLYIFIDKIFLPLKHRIHIHFWYEIFKHCFAMNETEYVILVTSAWMTILQITCNSFLHEHRRSSHFLLDLLPK